MIQVKTTQYNPDTPFAFPAASAGVSPSTGLPALFIHLEGGEHEYAALSEDHAAAAAAQVNQLIADGEGGTTILTEIEDF